MAGINMNVEFTTRFCEVKGELGYFHLWEQWSNVVDASPLRGGHPGGQIGQVYGIVEFRDGVRRVDPCSTMHKIADKEFTLDDFSHEHLNCEPYHRNWIESATVDEDITSPHKVWMTPLDILRCTIEMLNAYRESYLETKDKQDWWQMIQLLPSSYNQRRTVMLNYEVLANMYKSRRNHKLDEWHTFCDWIESLPYSELITGKGNSAPENSYCSGRR